MSISKVYLFACPEARVHSHVCIRVYVCSRATAHLVLALHSCAHCSGWVSTTLRVSTRSAQHVLFTDMPVVMCVLQFCWLQVARPSIFACLGGFQAIQWSNCIALNSLYFVLCLYFSNHVFVLSSGELSGHNVLPQFLSAPASRRMANLSLSRSRRSSLILQWSIDIVQPSLDHSCRSSIHFEIPSILILHCQVELCSSTNCLVRV